MPRRRGILLRIINTDLELHVRSDGCIWNLVVVRPWRAVLFEREEGPIEPYTVLYYHLNTCECPLERLRGMKRARVVIHRLSKGVTSEKQAITRDGHVEGKRLVYPSRLMFLLFHHIISHLVYQSLGQQLSRHMQATDTFDD